MKILLVTDSKFGKHPIADFLCELGVEFVTADNEKEACAKLQAFAPNIPTLILVDLSVPGKAGIELVRTI